MYSRNSLLSLTDGWPQQVLYSLPIVIVQAAGALFINIAVAIPELLRALAFGVWVFGAVVGRLLWLVYTVGHNLAEATVISAGVVCDHLWITNQVHLWRIGTLWIFEYIDELRAGA